VKLEQKYLKLEVHLEFRGQLARLWFMRSGDVATLEQRLNALMQNADVPGLALAAIRQRDIVYTGGFGVANRSSKTLIAPNSVFEAASLSKLVVAYATLQLCAEGLLELDGSISSLLGVRIDGQLKSVTLRYALSHTSGLPNWLADGEAPRTYFAPGSRFSYSGVGYRLIQQVIETVTGQPLAAYLESNVLRPLLMNDSSFIWRPDFNLRAATGHDSHGQATQKLQPLEAHAAFSLHSTAADLARFVIATMQPDSFAHRMFEAQVAVGDSAPWHPDWPRAEIQTFPNVYSVSHVCEVPSHKHGERCE
jgi:CubicO group peptidase (beta-lactamase class C family)